MKNLLIGLTILASASSFANAKKGLSVSDDFLIRVNILKETCVEGTTLYAGEISSVAGEFARCYERGYESLVLTSSNGHDKYIAKSVLNGCSGATVYSNDQFIGDCFASASFMLSQKKYSLDELFQYTCSEFNNGDDTKKCSDLMREVVRTEKLKHEKVLYAHKVLEATNYFNNAEDLKDYCALKFSESLPDFKKDLQERIKLGCMENNKSCKTKDIKYDFVVHPAFLKLGNIYDQSPYRITGCVLEASISI